MRTGERQGLCFQLFHAPPFFLFLIYFITCLLGGPIVATRESHARIEDTFRVRLSKNANRVPGPVIGYLKPEIMNCRNCGAIACIHCRKSLDN